MCFRNEIMRRSKLDTRHLSSHQPRSLVQARALLAPSSKLSSSCARWYLWLVSRYLSIYLSRYLPTNLPRTQLSLIWIASTHASTLRLQPSVRRSLQLILGLSLRLHIFHYDTTQEFVREILPGFISRRRSKCTQPFRELSWQFTGPFEAPRKDASRLQVDIVSYMYNIA